MIIISEIRYSTKWRMHVGNEIHFSNGTSLLFSFHVTPKPVLGITPTLQSRWDGIGYMLGGEGEKFYCVSRPHSMHTTALWNST